MDDEVVVSHANVAGDKVTAEDGAMEDVLTVGSDDSNTSEAGVDNDEAMKGKLKDSGGEADGTTMDGKAGIDEKTGKFATDGSVKADEDVGGVELVVIEDCKLNEIGAATG